MAIITPLTIEINMTIITTLAIKTNIAIVIILAIKTNKIIKTNIYLSGIQLGIKCGKLILK